MRAEPFDHVSLYIQVDWTKSVCTNKVWTMTVLKMYSTWSCVRIKATYIDRIASGSISCAPSAILFCSKKHCQGPITWLWDVLRFCLSRVMSGRFLDWWEVLVFYSRTQHSASRKAQTSGPLISSWENALACKMALYNQNINQRSYYNQPNSVFWGRLSLNIFHLNPELRNDPENFHLFMFQPAFAENWRPHKGYPVSQYTSYLCGKIT